MSRDAEATLRLQYLTDRLYRLGPGVLLYFLREIEAGADLRAHLETYATLPAEFIAAYGGDRLPDRVFAIRGSAR